MYQYDYSMPNNSNTMYSNEYQTPIYSNYNPNTSDERFFAPFFAPFVVGGLAGTALGYGIANNNQINKPCCPPGTIYYPYPYPIYQQSYPNNTNNFYY